MVTMVKKALSIVMLAALLTACIDAQYPPYIRNESSEPVFVIINYENRDKESKGLLQPKTNLGYSESGLIIESIRAKFSSGKIYLLRNDDILDLRKYLGETAFEVWLITDNGLRLIDSKYWDAIKVGKFRELKK